MQLWSLCSASVGAGYAGELIFEGQRGVSREMSLVRWDEQSFSRTLDWEINLVCPRGPRSSLRQFEGKVKGMVCPSGYLTALRLHTVWLVSSLCGQKGVRGNCSCDSQCFPARILQSSPSYVQQKREEKGTVGLCVSAPAKEDLSQREQFSPRANSDLHKVCPVD